MRIKSLFIFTILIFSLQGIVITNNAQSVDQATFTVAVVYTIGGLGDGAFNDMAYQGIQAAINNYPALTVDTACVSGCTNLADVEVAIDDFASDPDKDYDLIIGIGFNAYDGIFNAATNYPGQNFLIIDSVLDKENVASVIFEEEEGSFLAGAMAGLVDIDTVGFIGGLDIPLINRFGAGFIAGARYVDPTLSHLIAYSPDPNNPWGDIAGGEQVANEMLDEGADVILATAGGTNFGVFNAVEDRNQNSADQKYAVGSDFNQDGSSEGNILTSILKKVDIVIEDQIAKIISGTWTTGTQSYGLSENGVGITEMAFTQDVANQEYSPGVTNYDYIFQVKEDIIDGLITVPDNFNDVPQKVEEETYPTIVISEIEGQNAFNVTEFNLIPNETYKIVLQISEPYHNLRIDVDQDLESEGNVADPDDIVIGPQNDADNTGGIYEGLWTTPNEDGVFIFYCGYAGHYEAGMTGEFIVGDPDSNGNDNPDESDKEDPGIDLPIMSFDVVIISFFVSTVVLMVRRSRFTK